jgi:N6-adenosine-specific RNA methylase IME4/16S rRNA G966 N2-methylase RsmD
MAKLSFHPLADLFPLLEGDAFQELVDDIAAAPGLREPIWLHQDGRILDGRNRYLACQKLGIEAATRVYEGDDPLSFVISLNLKRRHLNESQRAMVGARLATLAKGANQHTEISAPSQSQAAKILSVSPDSIQFARKVQDNATPKVIAAVDSGKLAVSVAAKLAEDDPDHQRRVIELIEQGARAPAAVKAAEDERKKVRFHEPVLAALPSGLHHGDFRELSSCIPDNSVELVLTDPPYDKDSIALYGDAARIAARILKPGGSFLAYSGQKHLPEILPLCSEHLKYWWMLACLHSGSQQMLEKLGVRCGWKPIIWFVKDHRGDVASVLRDIINIGSEEKKLHDWQQSEAEAKHLIKEFTSPNGIVVDFCLGSGTVAVAAKKLGRKWIGFETDGSEINKIIKRLADGDMADERIPAPEGLYDVIVIDPPWPMEKIRREVRPNQIGMDYPTMTLEEIATLPIPAADDCHLFLWCTQKFLPAALDMLERWGFRYLFQMTWHKPGGFQPVGLPQYNSELILYGRKGTPHFLDTKAFPLCFDAPRGTHSEKPQTFYDLVARVTYGQRIDIGI